MAERRKRLSDLEAASVTDWLSQFGTGATGPGSVGPGVGIMAGLLSKATGDLASLPSRALASSESMRRGGQFDPAPFVEAGLMGPAVSAPMALRGAIDPATLAALYLSKKKDFGPYTEYSLLKETGENVGYMHARPRQEGRDVYVENIGTYESTPLPRESAAARYNLAAHALGPKEMRSWLMGLRHEFPSAETVSGYRVTGGRKAAGSVNRLAGDPLGEGNVMVRLPQFTDEQMKAYLAQAPKEELSMLDLARQRAIDRPRPRPVPEPTPAPSWLSELVQRAAEREQARRDWESFVQGIGRR